MTLSEFAIDLPALRDEARAKWGEEMRDVELNYYYSDVISNWQYHLQQMIDSDNPVKYLKDHSGKEA